MSTVGKIFERYIVRNRKRIFKEHWDKLSYFPKMSAVVKIYAFDLSSIMFIGRSLISSRIEVQ